MDPYHVIQNRCCEIDTTERSKASPYILKYTVHIQNTGCVMVDCTGKAVIREGAKKRKVSVVQLYWKTVLGMRAKNLECHLHRNCTGISDHICMNPGHIIYTRTKQSMAVVIPILQRRRCKMPASSFGGGRQPVREHAAYQEKCTGGHIAVVFDESTLPTHASDVQNSPTVIDYFRIQR
jgi:hypothetical protein